MTGAAARQPSNVKRFRDIVRISGGNGLDRELLLDGEHLLFEAHSAGATIEIAAFEHAVLEQPRVRTMADRLAAGGTEILIVSRKTIEAMSPVRTPSGVVAIARRSMVPVERALSIAPPLVVIAADVQDPGNVGALMRTAEAAGATAMIACGATADPFGWKALRGSMGSALRLPVARSTIEEALNTSRELNVAVGALTPRGGMAMFEADLRRPTALLIGSEGTGLAPAVMARADLQLSIPMESTVESLNVAVAAALVLFEARRQRK